MAPVFSTLASAPYFVDAAPPVVKIETGRSLDVASLAFTIPAGIVAAMKIFRMLKTWWRGRSVVRIAEIVAVDLDENDEYSLIEWWQEQKSLENQLEEEIAGWQQELSELSASGMKTRYAGDEAHGIEAYPHDGANPKACTVTDAEVDKSKDRMQDSKTLTENDLGGPFDRYRET